MYFCKKGSNYTRPYINPLVERFVDVLKNKTSAPTIHQEERLNAETVLQNKIRENLSDVAVTFRANVGLFYTANGIPVRTGLPNGFCDIFGFRKSDNTIFFIEVKTKKGRPSNDQKKFMAAMRRHGCRVGIARSIEDARRIVLSDREAEEG